ncbi:MULTISPECIES: hypothetical protein [unclassified Rhodococcus (in: high G+C Gram-positive bacteria)]|uniref:hypothetical protein n=1 Tax=unclassified Rhodococcus (in: high G+C Gram-positive bacteria) TaxID=192944 RepID=UPI0031402C9B
MDYPRITTEDRSHAVNPLSHKKAKTVDSKVDAYRRENPDAFHTWTTKSGGCVIQFWGMRVYYGRCEECSTLVTRRRNISHKKEGPTNIGRWPKYCAGCNTRKHEAHNDAARARMRRLRAGGRQRPFEFSGKRS